MTRNLRDEEFWIVTRPSETSTLADILFARSLPNLDTQFLGGLRRDDILGVFLNYEQAEAMAMLVLAEADAPCPNACQRHDLGVL